MSFTIYVENDHNLYLQDVATEEDRQPILDAEIVVHLGRLPARGVVVASNANPIVITSVAHGLTSGDQVIVSQVRGNDAANGLWEVANVTTDTFELVDSAGDGDHIVDELLGGGVWYPAVPGAVDIELVHVGGTRNAYRGVLSRDNGIISGQKLVMVLECANYGVKLEVQGVARVRR